MGYIFLLLLVLNVLKADNITISTQLGPITGTVENNYFVFRGIPFTDFPPTESNRFVQATVRNSTYTPDDTAYDATYFRPACIQNDPDIEIDEDCLHLNVFTPNVNTTAESLLPVMVWIYGGSWQTGSASNILYNGKGFMNQENGREIIYVSINYRLGALGYLSLESILDETNGVSSGGMNGIWDQVAALQWIQNNINEYGGDPSQVSVFGESAGGISICMLLATESEVVYNLFSQAIIQSGPCFGFPQQYEFGLTESANMLRDAGFNDNLDELRDLDALEFLNIPAGPCADGYLFDYSINVTTATTIELNADKILMGFTSMDTLYSFPFFVVNAVEEPPETERNLEHYLSVYMRDNDTLINEIKNTHYPISDFKNTYYAGNIITNYSMLWYTMNADVCFICPSIDYAQTLQSGVNSDVGNNDLFLYYFKGVDPYYIPHAGELPFLFNNSEAASNLFGIQWNELLSSFMIENWISFGVYGRPNSTLYPQEWQPFGIDETVMTFTDDNGNVDTDFVTNYRNGVCNFWLNEVDVDIVSNLCGQTLSVIQSDESDELETWAVVVISVAAVLVAVLLCFVLCKYKCCYYCVLGILWCKWCCCDRNTGSKTITTYERMEESKTETQLVAKKGYGTVDNDTRV